MSLGNPPLAECAGVKMVRGSDRTLSDTPPVRPETRFNRDAWTTKTDASRPFFKPGSRRITVKAINDLGDEAMRALGLLQALYTQSRAYGWILDHHSNGVTIRSGNSLR